jgi:hypothetical protein
LARPKPAKTTGTHAERVDAAERDEPAEIGADRIAAARAAAAAAAPRGTSQN